MTITEYKPSVSKYTKANLEAEIKRLKKQVKRMLQTQHNMNTATLLFGMWEIAVSNNGAHLQIGWRCLNLNGTESITL